MKIDRYVMYARFDYSVELVIDPDGSVCYTRDVAKLEAINAELLDALEVILDEDMEDSKRAGYLGGFVLPDDLRQQARAAIAKAKGESHED